MQVSKLGQGLATSAVSALLIAGLAVASPAHAADGAGVRLLSQQDGIASVKRDASEFYYFGASAQTVTLTAERFLLGSEVSFEYNADPAADDAADGWTPVFAMSSVTHGRYVSVDWIPDEGLIGTSIAIRAVASTPTDGAAMAPSTYSRRNNVLVSDEAEAVSLGSNFFPFPTTAGGFFKQPYADSGKTASLLAVSGTTSATDGTVELSVWNPAAVEFQGRVDAAVSPYDFKIWTGMGPPITIAGGSFASVLDITAYDAGDGDALALRAERESDEVTPVLLDQQTITTIQAYGPQVAGPEDNSVDIWVYDEDGLPVAGAEVRRSSDGSLVGYTDGRGYLAADQRSGTTESYYANTTDVDAFEEGTDVTTDPVVIGDYVPVATATVAELADGDVFDDQEYAPGDIALQVVDGRGDAFASEEQITYALTVPGEEPAEPVTVTTDENGRFAVPFDPADEDGEYTLTFTGPHTDVTFTGPDSARGDEEEPVTFVAGDAVLALTPLAGSAVSGGQITYDGSLTVEGEPLVDRDIDLAYTRGTEQAPGSEADAAIVTGDTRALTATASTDEDGTFAVTVGDVVETGGPAETGGSLRVTAHGLGDTLQATATFTAVVVPPATTPTTTPTPTPTPTPATGKGRIELTLAGSDARDGSDKLSVRGPASAAGLRVRIHVLTTGGFWRVAKGLDLDKSGDTSLTVADLNGEKVTQYRVRLIPNPLFKAFTSKVLRLR